MNILIVDDSKLNLMAAKEVISSSGIICNIITADSGEAAIDVINSEKIDIVLLDIIMHKLNGIETLEIIRKDHKNIIVLMFTSLTDKKYLEKSFALGANDYINKPIEPIEFTARLKSAIKTKEYYDALMESYYRLKSVNSELKESNIKLKKTQIELINKEKLSTIGRFSAGIAHEINTPLGYINSNLYTINKYGKALKENLEKYIEFVSKNKESFLDTDELNELLESKSKLEFVFNDFEPVMIETNDGITKISNIIKALIKFSNQDAYENYETNKFSELVQEAIAILNTELKDKKLKELVELEFLFEDHDFVKCNRFEMEQVIFNILINSIHFIKVKNEVGKIVIKTYKENGYFCCDIEDNGTGIQNDVINKIFDPFFTTKEIGEGMGLGLSICYDIVVAKHKGYLSAKSIHGEGTTISFKLPL